MSKILLLTANLLPALLTRPATRLALLARQRFIPSPVSCGAALLRITFIILLSGLAFCGCSRKHDAAKGSAIDLVKSGQDLAWPDGYVLRVTKRAGGSLKGIQIVKTPPDGQKKPIVADKGTVAKGADPNSVKITLYKAQVQRGNTQMSAHLMNLVLIR